MDLEGLYQKLHSELSKTLHKYMSEFSIRQQLLQEDLSNLAEKEFIKVISESMPDKQDMIADTMIQYQNIESKLITSNVSETESLEQNTQEEDSLLDTLQVVNDVRRASKITNVMPDTFDSFVSFNSEEDIYEAGTSVYDTASEESSMFNFMHKFKSSKDVATTTICSDCQRNPEILMNRFTQETKNQEVRVASQLTNAKVCV